MNVVATVKSRVRMSQSHEICILTKSVYYRKYNFFAIRLRQTFYEVYVNVNEECLKNW
jgi:hypothetical protein